MLSLVLSICLINDPGICREERLPILEEADAKRCVLAAPPTIAEWADAHPDWRIVRWQCKPPASRVDI